MVPGWGTETHTLEQAGVGRAVGLVVGTHNDANNLSIVMTARTLNPDLFIAVREHHKDNEELFRAVGANIVMHPSTIIADRIRILLVTPLLTEFEQLVRLQDHAWSCELVSRIVALVDHQVPDVWEVAFDNDNAHAICVLTGQGAEVTLGALLRDPRAREGSLPIIPLLLVQGGGQELLPSEDRQVGPGDRLLLCGRPLGHSRLGWTLQNVHSLNYVLTGGSSPEGTLWHWLSGRIKPAAGQRG